MDGTEPFDVWAKRASDVVEEVAAVEVRIAKEKRVEPDMMISGMMSTSQTVHELFSKRPDVLAAFLEPTKHPDGYIEVAMRDRPGVFRDLTVPVLQEAITKYGVCLITPKQCGEAVDVCVISHNQKTSPNSALQSLPPSTAFITHRTDTRVPANNWSVQKTDERTLAPSLNSPHRTVVCNNRLQPGVSRSTDWTVHKTDTCTLAPSAGVTLPHNVAPNGGAVILTSITDGCSIA